LSAFNSIAAELAPTKEVQDIVVENTASQESFGSEGADFAGLLELERDEILPRRGSLLEAVVVSIGENELIVDLGAKHDGVVPPSDLDRLADEYRASLRVGDRVPTQVVGPFDGERQVTVSLHQGLLQQDWLRAQELELSGEVVEAEVAACNRGGVIVSFGSLSGFVPRSHLTSVPRWLDAESFGERAAGLIGKTIALVIIEADRHRQRLVLSEREARPRRRQRLLDELVEGEVRTGVVCSLVDFGAFVDLGGVDGLVHRSELDWSRVDHPGDVVNVGDAIEVQVIRVDRDRGRIGLSRKRLLPDPWERVAAELGAGDAVEGSVTSVASFGVFVEVSEGVDGLLHNSRMPGGRAAHPDLQPGSRAVVHVISIDRPRQRIALSLVPDGEGEPDMAVDADS
jgi:small subunit ribosomal protein S1